MDYFLYSNNSQHICYGLNRMIIKQLKQYITNYMNTTLIFNLQAEKVDLEAETAAGADTKVAGKIVDIVDNTSQNVRNKRFK